LVSFWRTSHIHVLQTWRNAIKYCQLTAAESRLNRDCGLNENCFNATFTYLLFTVKFRHEIAKNCGESHGTSAFNYGLLDLDQSQYCQRNQLLSATRATQSPVTDDRRRPHLYTIKSPSFVTLGGDYNGRRQGERMSQADTGAPL